MLHTVRLNEVYHFDIYNRSYENIPHFKHAMQVFYGNTIKMKLLIVKPLKKIDPGNDYEFTIENDDFRGNI